MGTKNNPGPCDCYAKAEPDEPLFTLLARDKFAAALVGFWAILRENDGEKPEIVREAIELVGQICGYAHGIGRESMSATEAFRILKRFYESVGVNREPPKCGHADSIEADKLEGIREKLRAASIAAAENGFAVIKLSPRRSIVVRLGATSYGPDAGYSFWSGNGETNSVAYGPTNHTHCVEWVLASIREAHDKREKQLREMVIHFPAAYHPDALGLTMTPEEAATSGREPGPCGSTDHTDNTLYDSDRGKTPQAHPSAAPDEPPFSNELGENGAG